MFHLLTGHPPFQADSAVGVAMKQIGEPLPDISKEVPGISASLRSLFERMTQKERDARLPTCAEVVRQCEAVQNQLDATAPSDLPAALIERKARQRRVLMIAAGLGMSVALGLPLALSAWGASATRPCQATAAAPTRGPAPAADGCAPAATDKPVVPATGPVRIAVLRFKNLGADPA